MAPERIYVPGRLNRMTRTRTLARVCDAVTKVLDRRAAAVTRDPFDIVLDFSPAYESEHWEARFITACGAKQSQNIGEHDSPPKLIRLQLRHVVSLQEGAMAPDTSGGSRLFVLSSTDKSGNWPVATYREVIEE